MKPVPRRFSMLGILAVGSPVYLIQQPVFMNQTPCQILHPWVKSIAPPESRRIQPAGIIEREHSMRQVISVMLSAPDIGYRTATRPVIVSGRIYVPYRIVVGVGIWLLGATNIRV